MRVSVAVLVHVCECECECMLPLLPLQHCCSLHRHIHHQPPPHHCQLSPPPLDIWALLPATSCTQVPIMWIITEYDTTSIQHLHTQADDDHLTRKPSAMRCACGTILLFLFAQQYLGRILEIVSRRAETRPPWLSCYSLNTVFKQVFFFSNFNHEQFWRADCDLCK